GVGSLSQTQLRPKFGLTRRASHLAADQRTERTGATCEQDSVERRRPRLGLRSPAINRVLEITDDGEGHCGGPDGCPVGPEQQPVSRLAELAELLPHRCPCLATPPLGGPAGHAI